MLSKVKTTLKHHRIILNVYTIPAPRSTTLKLSLFILTYCSARQNLLKITLKLSNPNLKNVFAVQAKLNKPPADRGLSY